MRNKFTPLVLCTFVSVCTLLLSGCRNNPTVESINEEFDHGANAPDNWIFDGIGSTYDSDGNFGNESPSIRFDDSNDQITSPLFKEPIESLSFWFKGLGTDSKSKFIIAGYNGKSWVRIDEFNGNIDEFGTLTHYDFNSSPALPEEIVQIKFTYVKNRGNVGLDDLIIKGSDLSVANKTRINQGKIIYELSYPEFAADNIFISMFPREMTFKFKDGNTKNELKTSMAVFSTTLLANSKEKTVVHLVRIANKYSGIEMDSVEIMEEYGKKPDGMTITPTDSTKQIAGYICKHASVTFTSDSTKGFDIFYTSEIDIEAPNWCTPFHDIDGVLMEATITKFNMDMHMVAKQVVAEEYTTEEFIVTHEYQPITVDEMADIFQSF